MTRPVAVLGIDPGGAMGACLWGQRGHLWSEQLGVGVRGFRDIVAAIKSLNVELIAIAIEDHSFGGQDAKKAAWELRHNRGRIYGQLEVAKPTTAPIYDVQCQTWRSEKQGGHGKTRRAWIVDANGNRTQEHRDALADADRAYASAVSGREIRYRDEGAAVCVAKWCWGNHRLVHLASVARNGGGRHASD